jgi:single-strand DNA-binding protein
MYQQLILIGNLGSDPEMRYTPTGVAVTNFSLAVSRSWTGKDGQRQEKTIWFRINAWDKLAETANQYLSKGRQVFVVGELEEPRTFQDRDGNTRVSLDVRALTIKFLGKAGDGGGAPAHTANNNAQAPADHGPEMHDEDIPF